MSIWLTQHAQQRAEERGISYSEICETVLRGDEVHRDKTSRTMKFRRICVVLNLSNDDVVTVYRHFKKKKATKKLRQHKKKMYYFDLHALKK